LHQLCLVHDQPLAACRGLGGAQLVLQRCRHVLRHLAGLCLLRLPPLLLALLLLALPALLALLLVVLLLLLPLLMHASHSITIAIAISIVCC
jgi:hypothetical protein